MTLQAGMIVDVFEFPITREGFEGKAKLIELLQDGAVMQYWKVEFLTDKSNHYSRWIKT